MRIRMKFIKEGPVKYVGHLDTMRLFQRAIKVANLPVAYSQGFSPHSLVYFALPLGVGVSSQGEYMDIIMATDISPTESMERLNAVLVQGIRILDAFEIEDKSDSLMSLVTAADYEVSILLEDKTKELFSHVENQLSKESAPLFVLKKGKKGIKEVDIRPLILKAQATLMEDRIVLSMQVLAGSESNLNPELLVKALIGETPYQLQVVRKEMYGGSEPFIPLYRLNREDEQTNISGPNRAI